VYVRGKYGTVPFGIYREVYVRPFGTNRIGTGCVRTSNQTGYWMCTYVEELSVCYNSLVLVLESVLVGTSNQTGYWMCTYVGKISVLYRYEYWMCTGTHLNGYLAMCTGNEKHVILCFVTCDAQKSKMVRKPSFLQMFLFSVDVFRFCFQKSFLQMFPFSADIFRFCLETDDPFCYFQVRTAKCVLQNRQQILFS
jgi:hypothetical protein